MDLARMMREMAEELDATSVEGQLGPLGPWPGDDWVHVARNVGSLYSLCGEGPLEPCGKVSEGAVGGEHWCPDCRRIYGRPLS